MIFHPLLHLIASKPHLLADHVEAYSALIGAEIDKTTKRWISRVVYYAVALFLFSTAMTFVGVALMFWAVMPADEMNMPWLLIVVPVLPMLIGGFLLYRAQAEPEQSAFETVKEQLSADLAMLRQVNAST